jgi:hypothetical protein
VTFFHWLLLDIPANTRQINAGSHSNSIVPHGKSGPVAPGNLRHGINYYTVWFAGDAEMSAHCFSRNLPPELFCRFVGSKSRQNRVTQQPVAGPTQIGDFGDELRLDPMRACKDNRPSEAVMCCGGAQSKTPKSTGLTTEGFRDGTYEETRAKLVLDGRHLRSLVNSLSRGIETTRLLP